MQGSSTSLAYGLFKKMQPSNIWINTSSPATLATGFSDRINYYQISLNTQPPSGMCDIRNDSHFEDPGILFPMALPLPV